MRFLGWIATRRWSPTTVQASLLLAVWCAFLYSDAIPGGFKYDDATHLRFAADFAPWQYFTQAQVMREQSYAHITPMLALAFDLGIALAGMEARGHYILQLTVLWAIAVSTYWLLKRWLSSEMALAAGALFLALPGAASVAHMLMTAHYAWGLLFTVISLSAYSRAVDTDRPAWIAAAASSYAMACLSKELYVPMIIVMLAWPGINGSRRLRLAWPLVMVTAAYAVLRLWVLGGIGGYAALSSNRNYNFSGMPGILLQWIPDGLGGAWFGDATGLLLLIATLVGFHRRRPLNLWLSVSTALALIMPLVPLLLIPTPYGMSRTLVLVDWALAVLAVWCLEGSQLRVLFVALLIGLSALGSRQITNALDDAQKIVKAENDWIVHGDTATGLVPDQFRGLHYLESMRKARLGIEGVVAPAIIGNTEELISMGVENGRRAMAWEVQCMCLTPLGSRYDSLVDSVRRKVSDGLANPLTVTLRLKDKGRVKVLGWSIAGSEGKTYLEVLHYGRLDVPAFGELAFGLDTTVMLGNSFQLRAVVETSDGAMVRSHWLELRTDGDSSVEWSTP